VIEILIISGKGGTGKTSLTAAFAHLAENHVICDLDVDAPDMHLILKPNNTKSMEFISGHEAVINPDKCEACGKCLEMCQYGAVNENNDIFSIDPLKCEGCKVRVEFCPVNAIDFPQKKCGHWYSSDTRFGPMIHAQLFPGEENSGLLVSMLRKKAKEMAKEKGLDLILSDGTPGIGCPVIASLSGVTLAVIVTEPTPSGRHDLERVAELCGHFNVPVGIIINKCDLNDKEAAAIENYSRKKGFTLFGNLPHDPVITRAMINAQAITEYGDNDFAKQLTQIWERIIRSVQPTKTY
jgi:MinD superfamily P-loop ATPase